MRRFHDLRIGMKNTFDRTHPVWCPHCKKHFSGRNRAKIWQHVSGQEHRRAFNQHRRMQQPEPLQDRDPQPAQPNASAVSPGTCSGLSLNSQLGQGTRLGSVPGLCYDVSTFFLGGVCSATRSLKFFWLCADLSSGPPTSMGGVLPVLRSDSH